MSRIQAIDPAAATDRASQILDAVQKKLGMTPNLIRTMANQPAVGSQSMSKLRVVALLVSSVIERRVPYHRLAALRHPLRETLEAVVASADGFYELRICVADRTSPIEPVGAPEPSR